MSIKENVEKIKSFWVIHKAKLYNEEKGLKLKGDFFVVILIVLVGLISFGLGKLSALEKTSAVVGTHNEINTVATALESSNLPIKSVSTPKAIVENSEGMVFASKSGTRYYYPDCSSRVKEENKIWFNSIEEAEATGRTLASGCNK